MIGKGWVAMREDTALFRLVKIGSARVGDACECVVYDGELPEY